MSQLESSNRILRPWTKDPIFGSLEELLDLLHQVPRRSKLQRGGWRNEARIVAWQESDLPRSLIIVLTRASPWTLTNGDMAVVIVRVHALVGAPLEVLDIGVGNLSVADDVLDAWVVGLSKSLS